MFVVVKSRQRTREQVSKWAVSLQETLKNFILQKDRGELTVQKEGDLRQNILKPVRYVKYFFMMYSTRLQDEQVIR